MKTLGSLFDGSGGFPLAGALSGVTPIWASEIEPYPIAVTRSRFPQMQHLGSVTEVHGDKVQPVDVITFGSPCQDMSVAGKRAGMKHEEKGDDATTRSGLFYEAIRIIREMREETNGQQPTFAVWENVPGAFSSNKGEDFRYVLEEFAKIREGGCSIPRPAGGKWNHAGEIVGNGFSIAWRLFDAQYWGVPQRRKRIYLVADFAGERAGKILFEREGLRGDTAACRTSREGIAADAAGSAGGSNRLRCMNPWNCQSKRIYQPEGVYPTLPAMDCGGANNQAVLYEPRSAMDENWAESNVKNALRANASKSSHAVCCALDSMSSNPNSGFHTEKVAKTLQASGADPTCNQGGNVIVEPVYALQGNGIDRADTAGCNGCGWREDVCYTLNTIDRPAICFKPGQGAKARSMGESETTAPTLASETGGNAVPGVCYPEVFHTLTALNARNPESAQQPNCVCYDARGNGDGAHCPTSTGDHENRVTDYTAVYIMAHGQSNTEIAENKSPTLNCNHEQPIASYGVDCRNGVIDAGKTHTPQAKANGGQSLSCTPCVLSNGKPPRKYIIRRLTPLECCRLQGFPDGWGDIPQKDRLTDEEADFYENVRRIYAQAMGKKYTPCRNVDALLKWYNKLHTDSAEYKMWGNGIALPNAAFVLAGIAEAMNGGMKNHDHRTERAGGTRD